MTEKAHPRSDRAHLRFKKVHFRFVIAHRMSESLFRLDMPISGLRRSFASLRRSNPGLRSNSAHSSLRRVYSRHEIIDFSSVISGQPHLRHEKGLFMPQGLNSHGILFWSHRADPKSEKESIVEF